MINKLIYECRIIKCTYRNDRVLNFICANEGRMTHEKVKMTCFKPELFEDIVGNIGNVVIFNCEFHENNYKDKNDKWVNTYTLDVKSMSKIDEN